MSDLLNSSINLSKLCVIQTDALAMLSHVRVQMHIRQVWEYVVLCGDLHVTPKNLYFGCSKSTSLSSRQRVLPVVAASDHRQHQSKTNVYCIFETSKYI